MKLIFTVISFLFLTIAQSQELKTIKLLPPESKEVTDLSFLKDELQGKQLVMLGEQTHMYGNIFAMKFRVIKYLHESLGFNTIAMESPMYDIWKMDENSFNKKEFNNAIWGVWSGSSEFQELVDYIAENNLKVIGFDSQIINTSKFIDDFFDYCEAENIEIKLDEDDMGIIIEGILENATVEESDIKFSKYEKELERIVQEIEKLASNETNYYWKQFTKSLLASSEDAYFNKEAILTTDFGNKNLNIRDKQMADNLLSYVKRNPTEKIVVWADNIHIMNNQSSVQKPFEKDFISMGTYIKKALQDKEYSLATIHANDSLFDYSTGKWDETPIERNSFEDKLNKLNTPYLFVSSNQEAMRTSKETRLLNFIDFTAARMDQLHDGYIFFQHAILPKKETEALAEQKEQPDLGKPIAPIEKGQNVLLKGQILQKQTNEPIPFATLILKKEEIYRVADENGFYELPVKKAMMQNVSVAISSMGFESSTILLKNLNDKTYLKPKFEELSAVVVTGFLSPKTVLKKAVSKKKINHPVEPFNFYRYGKVLINKNDTTSLDFELITKDYDHGYLSPFVITQKVEQIKWDKNRHPKRYELAAQFFSYRQNAIRYANILHKRKYKKFKLNFVKSDDPEDEGEYIIAFETERNKWSYTNRSYPTHYSGRVYINKKNFAIVKVVENWETTLNEDEIKKYFENIDSYDDIIQTTIKEENICNYADVLNDGKYYATEYFNRKYNETINKEGKREHSLYERESHLFDFETKNVEEIKYWEYDNREENSLNRVEYDKSFWDAFYKNQLAKISQ